jgi:hypothetical protein
MAQVWLLQKECNLVGVNSINNLRETFSNESFAQSFFVLEVWVELAQMH